jgi:phage anti-repressor protein
MVEYGFVEGVDFCSKMSESTGGRPAVNHELTIDMAKEISMIQRNERGKQARLYFIECEKRLKGKPMTQLEILAQNVKLLQEQERRLSIMELDIEDVKETQRIQNSRLDTFNGVCIEGTKRQKLVYMITAYTTKNGLAFNEGWRHFKDAYNKAFHTNITLSIKYYTEKMGLKKKPTLPEFLEIKGLLDDALRIADKMLNGKIAA